MSHDIVNLHSGMHVLVCPNGNRKLVTQDPATMDAETIKAHCDGISTYSLPGYKLVQRADGKWEPFKID